MDKIKIMALGGLDEDGKDLYVIEINNDIFVFCAGFKYPTKLTPGIDFIMADFSYLKENKERIKAYILPKNKKNSFGALPYIFKECPAPIYSCKLTQLLFENFARTYQQDCNFDFRNITLPSTITIAGRKFTFFSTCASMPLTFGFSVETSLGNIVYSGDFIVEYSNERFFTLDLNTLGKIAEVPTIALLSESVNADKKGYCSPNHRLLPFFTKAFKEAPGRCFVALASDNLYHIDEFFRACYDQKKKICFYDKNSLDIYNLRFYGGDQYYPKTEIVPLDDILRIKEKDLVILMTEEDDSIYDKISLLANQENESKQIRINSNDTFVLGISPTDNNEVIATSTIDELYKTGCNVLYVTKKTLAKMHAYEEDLKMLLSLLKPKYYFPIEGYYVNQLQNAKMAFDMGIGLSHNNIFLLDNGQQLCIDNNGASVNFNSDGKIIVGDVMIDGIGVGDVVNDIITDRTRLSDDGVVVLGSGVSKSLRKMVCGPDVQMRGFLFLKDKEADLMIKAVTKMYIEDIQAWLETTKDFSIEQITGKITEKITKYIFSITGRNPVIKPTLIVLD